MIDAMEFSVLEEPSDPEMEEWITLLPDPGNTNGRLTLYKRALHMYWVMKPLLARAMEQVDVEMAEIAHGMPAMTKEMNNLQLMMRNQDNKIEEVRALLKDLAMAKQEEGGKQEIWVD